MTRKRLAVLAALALLAAAALLAGCEAVLLPDTPARAGATATAWATTRVAPTTTATAPALGPGGRVVMTLAPDSRPTSAAPMLQLDIEVVDASTRRRVDGALVAVDGTDLAYGWDAAEIAPGCPNWK